MGWLAIPFPIYCISKHSKKLHCLDSINKQINSREVSKYNSPLWISVSYRKEGHKTQRKAAPDKRIAKDIQNQVEIIREDDVPSGEKTI